MPFEPFIITTSFCTYFQIQSQLFSHRMKQSYLSFHGYVHGYVQHGYVNMVI